MPQPDRSIGIGQAEQGCSSCAMAGSHLFMSHLPAGDGQAQVVAPTSEAPQPDSSLAFGQAEQERLTSILKQYEGTRNFHNFTVKLPASDPSAMRLADLVCRVLVGCKADLHTLRRSRYPEMGVGVDTCPGVGHGHLGGAWAVKCNLVVAWRTQ